MVRMDNQDLSIPTLPSVPPRDARRPATLSAVPPVAEERPEEAFGAPRRAPAGGIRRKLGSIAAAIAAAVAKFFAAIKGLILLLPKAKLLTTAGTALVSVAAYALFWGWTFAVGLRGAAVRPRDGPRGRSCAARGSRPARRCSSPSWAR